MVVTTRRAIVAGTALLAAGTVAAAAVLRKPANPLYTPIKASAPEFITLQDMSTMVFTEPPRKVSQVAFMDAEDVPHRLADFSGKGVVLNLWATWCIPCVAELPALARLAKQVADDGIVVLPVSSDRGGAPVVERFYASRGLDDLPVLMDKNGAAGRALAARGVPTTIIIDRNGRERARLEGGADWASTEAMATIRRLVG
jgi:thiol-disulfide isomerase/thioredoxin